MMFRCVIVDRLGLSVTDAECIDFLMDAGSATAGELAHQTNLTAGAITGMIRRLENAGYVVSERDPTDGRRVIITPVPERLTEGKELYAAYGKGAEKAIADYYADQPRFLVQHYDRLSAV
jgi:MarR family transcriptional regulator, organic hydroperoxide resistance regulator